MFGTWAQRDPPSCSLSFNGSREVILLNPLRAGHASQAACACALPRTSEQTCEAAALLHSLFSSSPFVISSLLQHILPVTRARGGRFYQAPLKFRFGAKKACRSLSQLNFSKTTFQRSAQEHTNKPLFLRR
jgi:hypothetical protein